MSKDNNQKEYEHDYVEVPHTPPAPTQAHMPTQKQLEEWERIRKSLITTLCYVENMSNNNNQNQHEHHVQVPPPPPPPRKTYPKQKEWPEEHPCVGCVVLILLLVIIAFACYGVIRMVRDANN